MNTSENTITTTGDVIRKESARQAVILIFGLVGTVTTIWVVRYFRDPDRMSLIQMQSLLWIKRFAQKEADWWQKIADYAATEFNRMKDY